MAIPLLLRRLNRWIVWKLHRTDSGLLTKRPRGSLLDPELPRPFAEVQHEPNKGFVFTGGVDVDDGRLIALDLDGCRDPATGAVAEWALAVLADHQNSYTTVTVSGTGLRQWVVVANPPPSGPQIRVPEPAPPGVSKQPGVQVFGCGSAQFVTVGEDHLPGTSTEILVVQDLRTLFARFAVPDPKVVDVALPVGRCAPPTPAQLRAALLEVPNGAALLAGDWAAIMPDRSASEAWNRLVTHALALSHGHGAAVVDFLLGTAWGQGLVDSKDPERYTRRNWVAKDVARIAGKAGREEAAKAFDDGFDAESWAPPDSVTTGPAGAWLVPAAAFVQLPRAARFLVYGLLPQCGLAQIFGDPGCGKTPLAVSLALHVAAGRPEWFQHELDSPGVVVYMVGEDAKGIADRITAQAQRLGCGLDRLFVSTRPGRLTDAKNRAAWVQHIRRTVAAHHIRLLVVDTQSRNFGDGNENATEDMNAFVDQLQSLASELQCLVLLVHHTGHKEKDRSRGSSVLPGALDAQFEITREGALVRARPTKNKNWAAPAPLEGALVVVEIGTDEKGRAVTAITLDDTPPAPGDVFKDDLQITDELLALLQAVDETKGAPISQEELAKKCGVSRKGLRALLEQAENVGPLLEKSGDVSAGHKHAYVLTETGLMFRANDVRSLF